MRTKVPLIASAAAALALPAIAQQAAQTQRPPANQYPTTAPAQAPSTAPSTTFDGTGAADETAVEQVNQLNLAPPTPPVEYPGWARRDPWVVGKLDPAAQGIGAEPWGTASGVFLSTLPKQQPTHTIEVPVQQGGNAH